MTRFRKQPIRIIAVLIILVGTFSGTLLYLNAQRDTNENPKDWFKGAIIYQIFPRSFRDSNGDGIGDIQGIIDSLDYIQSLGANTLWLTPVYPTSTYHGYDVADYFNVNLDFGTTEDLIRLIQEVHRRDMYILLDYVANHSSSQHPFFIDAYNNPASPYSGYYHWLDEQQTRYQTFSDIRVMPRLNYESEGLREHMLNVVRFWLDPNGDGNFDDGVDGFRCDIAGGPPHDFWKQVRAAMDEINPATVIMGEFWTDRQKIPDFFEGNQFDSAFDFPVYTALTFVYEMNNDGPMAGAQPVSLISDALREAKTLYPEDKVMVRFLNNHDTNRIMDDVGVDWDRAKAAAVWLLTAPGGVMLYQGEEIGMRGSKTDLAPYWDENVRTPFEWYQNLWGDGLTNWFQGKMTFPNDGISVEEQDGRSDSLLTLYRTLGTLRANEPALRRGDYGLPEVDNDIYVIQRTDGGKVFTVVINFSQEEQTWAMSREARSEVMSNLTSVQDGLLILQPAGYAIYTN